MLKRNETAPFDLLTWLEGHTTGRGAFEDRHGRLRRSFTLEAIGQSRGNTLTLDETFHFDDGEEQRRRWILTRGAHGSFTGTCNDAVGAAEGRFINGAAYLASALRLKVGRRQVALRFDDAFYPAGPGEVLNRSYVSKWGLRIGQVLILFRKKDQRSP